MEAQRQIKSKKRIADHGEVFTNEREVNAMLDLVKHQTEQFDSLFLEPACGNGNFLAEVLSRKLNGFNKKYRKSQVEWERHAVIAVSSLYGVDIQEDNVIECRDRLFTIFFKRYNSNFGKQCKPGMLRSIKFILERNILWGHALYFTKPNSDEPLVFSEWRMVRDGNIRRLDYVFEYLVKKSNQFSIDHNDEGNAAYKDEPIKVFPLIKYFNIGT